MKRVLRSARWVFVTVGVIALTSVTVDATLSSNSISQSALAILANSLQEGPLGCGERMTRLAGEFAHVCVDLYEASPAAVCPKKEVKNAQDTRTNMDSSICKAESRADALPWTFVTLHQAQELCARSGKYLLSNAEWYRASVGSPDIPGEESCNIDSREPWKTGSHLTCQSGTGAYDMIGNVWEWVDEEVANGVYDARTLPVSGYVAEADTDGVVTATSADVPNPDYHDDYFWAESTGVFGMLRGGFHGSKTDAGLYSIQAKTPPSFAGSAIGFRCAEALNQ